MCRFLFFVREGPVITHSFKNLKGVLQGWKNSLGLWIQEQLHQKYRGKFTKDIAKSWGIGSRTVQTVWFSPKGDMISMLQHFLYWRLLWSQQDYRLSSLNKVRCHKKSWKLWCEEQTGPPCPVPPPEKPQTPHSVCWTSETKELPSVHQFSHFSM